MELSALIHKLTQRRHGKIQLVADSLDCTEWNAIYPRHITHREGFHIHSACSECPSERLFVFPARDRTGSHKYTVPRNSLDSLVIHRFDNFLWLKDFSDLQLGNKCAGESC